MRHCGWSALQVSNAVRRLKLWVVDLFFKLLRINIIKESLVLKYHKLINSLVHYLVIIIIDQFKNAELEKWKGPQPCLAAPNQWRKYPPYKAEFVVNDRTLEHIKQFNGNYCFISICGDYRSGKSFLLNSLFFDYSGFETSSSTESCTKGIKLWSQPI